MTPASSARDQRCRVTVDEIEGFRITIPVDLAPAEGCLLVGGLVVWVLVEILSLFLLIDATRGTRHVGEAYIPARLLFFVAWTGVGVAYVVWLIPWSGRRESIVIDADQLIIRREGGVSGTAESYSLAMMKNLRYSPPPGLFDPGRSRGSAQSFAGNIAFDYDRSTIRFAPGLAENECRRLIRTIKDRYKIPDDRDEPLPVERL